MTASLDRVHAAIVGWLEDAHDRPLVLGLCGSQGSGKSTLAAGLRDRLIAAGKRVAILSLDDLYLSSAERQARGAARSTARSPSPTPHCSRRSTNWFCSPRRG